MAYDPEREEREYQARINRSVDRIVASSTASAWWCEIDYLCIEGGSGNTRMYLGEIPKWLDEHKGNMIIRIKELHKVHTNV